MSIAFLGIGRMGAPMSRRLHAAGVDLVVWNRTRGKAAAIGARVAETPAAAAEGAEVVIAMLDTAAATDEVLFTSGAVEALGRGSQVIVMSSLAPSESRRHHDRLASLGLGHLDAPVSGGVEAAQAGTLAIMVGGNVDAFTAVRPVLAHMGRATHVGPPGSGQLAKLANQIIVAGTISVVAEALLFAKAGGADPAAVRDAIRGGFAESRILELHAQRMLARDFAPRGSSRNQLKDLRNVEAEAQAHGLELPTTNVVRALFERLTAMGLDELDHSAALLALEAINA